MDCSIDTVRKGASRRAKIDFKALNEAKTKIRDLADGPLDPASLEPEERLADAASEPASEEPASVIGVFAIGGIDDAAQ